MTMTTLIGLGASICTGISLLPQLMKIYKEKKAADISYPMLLILMMGLILWVWYGVKKEDLIIIISNAVSLSILNTFPLSVRDRERLAQKEREEEEDCSGMFAGYSRKNPSANH